MNKHKALMLGDEIPNEEVKVDILPTSKYRQTNDDIENYGKKIRFLTPMEREVAINVAEGIRYNAVAEILGIDSRTVKIIANRKHVKEFITEYISETTALLKARREQILAQIIEAKLDKITDLSEASNLDIAQLLAMLDTMGKEREKAELQAGNKNQIINVLQLIKKDN